MKQQKILIPVLGLLVSMHLCAQTSIGSDGWEQAQLELEHSHWRLAYDEFVRLADRGDAAASRTAYQMWLYAPMLYGQIFPARMDQLRQWADLCECAPVQRTPKPFARSTATP